MNNNTHLTELGHSPDALAQCQAAPEVSSDNQLVGDKADEQLANLKLELAGLDMGLTVI